MEIEDKRLIERREFLELALLGLGLAACRGKIPETLPVVTVPTKTPFSPTSPTQASEIPLSPSDTIESSEITPSATETVTPESSPIADSKTMMERYIYPALYQTVEKGRKRKAKEDEEYWYRVDERLNQDRVNLILLGRNGSLTDSIHGLSLDLKRNELKDITMHRDTQAPEISRFKENNTPYRINHAYYYGGFPLIERTLEDATGLSADFVIVFEKRVAARLVRNVFDDRLKVNLPWGVPTFRGYYGPGEHVLSGVEVATVARERKYGSNWHRNIVQQAVLKGLFERVEEELSKGVERSAIFIGKSLQFLTIEASRGAITTNVDSKVFIQLGVGLINAIVKEGITADVEGFGMPVFGEGYHLESQNAGYSGAYRYFHKPRGGDPMAEDLIKDYWRSFRKQSRQFLLE